MSIVWDDGTGMASSSHVFIAEQIRGKTYFIDPQTGIANADYYFESILPSFTEICRVDNLEFNQKIRKYCETAKKG